MEGKLKKMFGLLIYVLMSATGLIVIKLGLNRENTLQIGKNGVIVALNWIIIVGICMYILSFLLNMLAMKNMNLSIFYPVSAGLIYMLICVLSYWILKEQISIEQVIGMIIIFVGIIVMNLNKVL